MPLERALRCFTNNVERLEAEHGGAPPAEDLRATLDWNLNTGLAALAIALRDLYEALKDEPAPPEL